MSLLQRLWMLIRRPTGYVGKDLIGNHFYEYASANGGRTRRVVKFKGMDDMLAVANRNRLLAVQWKAWLTHTRSEPPTLQELQMDVARMERLRQNVAMIEARDREARLQLERPTTDMPPNLQETEQLRGVSNRVGSSSKVTPEALPLTNEAGLQSPANSMAATTNHDPWMPRPASDEPAPWQPQTVQRG